MKTNITITETHIDPITGHESELVSSITDAGRCDSVYSLVMLAEQAIAGLGYFPKGHLEYVEEGD